MSDKILTVIVPSYNMEKYLPKCLGSLIVATELMERVEVIVVNDGSTDRTSEIAHGFAANYPQTFKVIDKPNGHYGSCVNAGLKVATGQYVKTLDADDTFESNEFTVWLKGLANLDKLCDVIFTDYVQVNEQNAVTAKVSLKLPTNREVDTDFLDRWGYIAMHAIAYRLGLLKEISYRQTEGVAYTDTEWACRPLAHARSCFYFPIVVYRYLLGREGQSADPVVVSKSGAQMATVARNLADRFAKDRQNLSMPARAFYARSVQRVCLMAYNVYLLNAPISSSDGPLVDFDCYLREILPEIRAQVLQSRIPRQYGIAYIRVWLRYPWLRHFLLHVIRTYLSLRKV